MGLSLVKSGTFGGQKSYSWKAKVPQLECNCRTFAKWCVAARPRALCASAQLSDSERSSAPYLGPPPEEEVVVAAVAVAKVEPPEMVASVDRPWKMEPPERVHPLNTV